MTKCAYCSKDLTYDLSTNELGLCEECFSDPEIVEEIQQQEEDRINFNSYYNNYIHDYED